MKHGVADRRAVTAVLVLGAALGPVVSDAARRSRNLRTRSESGVPDPRCATGVLSLYSNKKQVCCPGYCGECSDYHTCRNVRGQNSTNACCASQVYAMRCGQAPANACLRSCAESLPPCIMEEPSPPKFHFRTASTDCNKVLEDWRLKVAAAMGEGNAQGPSKAAVKLDELIATSSKAVGLGTFSFLMGDEEGIRYATRADDGLSLAPFNSSDPKEPFIVFSAGKWLVAAALGAAVQAGKFAWEDPVSKYIPWWTRDEDDKRSHITFQHLLSLTSGLVASTKLLKALGYPDGVMDGMDHADVGLWDSSYTLEETAKEIYEGTDPKKIPSLPAPFLYGETHFIVAQYAAMQATKTASWQDFFSKYWATPLGIRWEVTSSELSSTKKFFKTKDAAYTYGFFRTSDGKALEKFEGGFGNIAGGEKVPNPDGGSQLIVSACTFARFLTSYLRQGDLLYGASHLDKTYADNTNYALGHWVMPEMKVAHSVGLAATLPTIVTLPNGKKFWFHFQQYAYGKVGHALSLVEQILPVLREFMAAPPPVDGAVCM